MDLVGEQILLRVYLESADRAPHTPTYERLVLAARRERLAGATVIRGILGAGYHGIIRQSRWSLVEQVPVIVEIVDSATRVAEFIKGPLDEILIGGMLTLERAAVAMYRPGTRGPNLAAPAARACPKCGSADAPALASFCPQCGAALTGSIQTAPELQPLSTLPAIQPGAHMTIKENGILLRVFIGESDQLQGKPLFEAIVQKVRELGLAGATVLRGSEGFGAHSVVHKSTLLEMSTDLPIVIEVVDTKDKIQLLLPHLDQLVLEGMVTMEYVAILIYRHGRESETPPATAPR